MKKILGLFAPVEMVSTPKNTSDESTSFPELVTLPKAFFYVMFLTLLAIGCQNASEPFSESPIVGVWKMSNYAFADGDTSFSYVPQPNLMICTEKYYSVETVNGTKPRPLIPDGKTRRTISDAERIAILVPYTSLSGTYEIEGDSVVSTPLVALTPNSMQGVKVKYHFKTEGDSTLILKTASGNLTLTYQKLE